MARCPASDAQVRARLLEMEARLAPASVWVMAVMLPVTVFSLVFDGWRAIGILLQPPLYGFLSQRLPKAKHPERLVTTVLLLGQLAFGLTIALTGGPVSPYLPFVIPTALSVAPRLGPRAVDHATLATVVIVLASTLAVDPAGFMRAPVWTMTTLGVCVLVAAFARVMVRAELEQRSEALLDPLTELPNRKALHRRFAELEARSERTGAETSLLLMDLDDFKGINDTLGHEHGDRVLRAVADVLRRELRGNEPAYRLGGDELLVALPDTNAAQATALAERLRSAVSNGAPVTASVGVATARGDEARFEHLYRSADTALYAAKHGGRDRVADCSTLAPA